MGLTARSDCCLHGARLSRPPKHSPSLLLFPPTAPVVCCQRLARGQRQCFCQFQILTIEKEALNFFSYLTASAFDRTLHHSLHTFKTMQPESVYMGRVGHFITTLKPSVNVCTVKVGHHVLKTIIIIIKKICFLFGFLVQQKRDTSI